MNTSIACRPSSSLRHRISRQRPARWICCLALIQAVLLLPAVETEPAATYKKTEGGAAQGTKTAKGKEPRGTAEYYLKLLADFENPAPKLAHYHATALAALAAQSDTTYGDLAGNAEFQQAAADLGLTHLGGPMLGCLTDTGVRVWVRTLRPAQVEVVVSGAGGERRFGPVASTVQSDLSAIVPVTGLQPGTSHPYRVLIDGHPARIPDGATITTAPKDGPAQVRIAFGADPHVWGFGNARQAECILQRKPAALVMYGDLASQDNGGHRGLMRGGYFVRDAFAAWRTLAASIPSYATWDDHDYYANDVSGVGRQCTPEDRSRLYQVFRQGWNNPAYGFGGDGDSGGVFLRTRIGPCDIIMTDNRYFRESGSFLGEGQMKWLQAQLLDCKGPFIMLSCGTMWSDFVDEGKDSWGKADPEGRERLFSFIEQNRIGGVLLLSGDRHGARGFRISRPSGFTFYEFEPGSLGGRFGPPAKKAEWEKDQLFGFTNIYAFGEFTIDATLSDPEVVFRLIREDSAVLYDLKLKRSELTPGR